MRGIKLYVILVVVTLSSCVKEYHSPGRLRIEYDWSALRQNANKPASLDVDTYNIRGGSENDFSGATAYEKIMGIGCYNTLIYTYDIPGIGLRGIGDMNGLEAFVGSAANYFAAPANNIADPLDMPDAGDFLMGYRSFVPDIVINSEQGVTKPSTLKVFTRVLYYFIDVTSTEPVLSCGGTFTNVADIVNIETGRLSSSNNGVVDLVVSQSPTGYIVKALFFGHYDEEAVLPNNLNLTFGFTGGGTANYSLNMSPEMDGVDTGEKLVVTGRLTLDVLRNVDGTYTALLLEWIGEDGGIIDVGGQGNP